MGIDNKEGSDSNLYEDTKKELWDLRAQLEYSEEKVNDKFLTLFKKIESSTSRDDDIYVRNGEDQIKMFREIGKEEGISHEKIEKMVNDDKERLAEKEIVIWNRDKLTTTRLSKMYDGTYKVEQERYRGPDAGDERIVQDNLSSVEVHKFLSLVEEKFTKMKKAKDMKKGQEEKKEQENRRKKVSNLLYNS